MKHNYFKKIALGSLMLSALNVGYAQIQTVGVLYSAGGSYGEPGNQVSFGMYEPNLQEVFTIDTFAGDFSNFVEYADGVAYVHIGRGVSHPDGADVVAAYYTYNDSVGLINNINGAKRIQSTTDYVAILKAFGTDNGQYLELFDKNDLNTRVYADSLTINVGGLAYDKNNEQLFASYSNEESGEIAAYDLSNGVSKLGVLLSDTMLKGIKQIYFDEVNNWIVGASKNSFYNQQWEEVIVSQRLFKLDLNLDSLYIVDVAKVSGSIKYVEEALVGDFGQGLSVFDVVNMEMIIEPLSAQPFTDFEVDYDNNELYLLNTDYFSFGSITRTGLFDTTTVDVASVGISGESIKLLQSYSPVAVNDYYEVSKNGNLNFDPSENDTDEDLPSKASLEVDFETLTTLNGSVTYSQISGFIYSPNQDFIGLDSVSYYVYDNVGLSATGMVYFNVSETNNVQEFSAVALDVYPNPTTNFVQFSLESNSNASVVIYNAQGQEVQSEKIASVNNKINVSDLPVGHFIIEVRIGEEVYRSSFEKI